MKDRDPLPEIDDDRLTQLFRRGSEAWDEYRARCDGRYSSFIPADYRAAYDALRRLRARAHSFLELGSGAGVITILADLLGFEAYGIEIEPELVQIARDLAQASDSNATFEEGSFVPVDFRDSVELLDGDFLTVTEGADAYGELGMEIADYDLVYAYPWPGEEDWIEELVRREAGLHTALLTYSVSDGFELTEFP